MQKTQTFLKENKNLVISIAIIVVIIGLGLIFSKGKAGKDTGNDNKSEDTSYVDQALENKNTYVVTEPKTTPAPRLSYDDALVVYQDSRIQFGETCAASKFINSTVKNGTTLMIDNRSKDSKTFTVGSVAHFVPAYDYTLVTLNYSNLPQTVYIDCGTQQNSATILVQE